MIRPVDFAWRWTDRPGRIPQSAIALLEGSRRTHGTTRGVTASFRRAIRFVRIMVSSAIIGGVGLLLAGLTIPALFGFHNFVVLSSSMEPTIHVGDLVVDQEISPLDARVGDIVTFPDPESPSRLITHRIRTIRIAGDVARLTTKGDASNGVQRWSIRTDGRIGRAVVHLWKLGWLLVWFTNRWGRMLLVVAPVVALVVYEVKRIWWPGRRVRDATT